MAISHCISQLIPVTCYDSKGWFWVNSKEYLLLAVLKIEVYRLKQLLYLKKNFVYLVDKGFIGKGNTATLNNLLNH